MIVCKNCGCSESIERATGKTTRAALRAALALSEGKRVVVYYGPRDTWTRAAMMNRFKDVCGPLDLISRVSNGTIYSKHNDGYIKFMRTNESILGLSVDEEWAYSDC